MIRETDIQLNYPFLYSWKQAGNMHILTNTEAAPYFLAFPNVSSEQTAFDVLNTTRGNFAVILNGEEHLFAAVDRVRSFPLFYKIENEKLIITDNIPVAETKFVFDEAAIATFQNIFCTEGDTTLLQNWKQLQAGEFLFLNKKDGNLIVRRYFSFEQRVPERKIDSNKLKNIYLDVFRSLLDEIGDRPIIVPLSGGYDSRCIVAALTELKTKNIFAYTYGSKNSPEKQTAEKVAKQLKLNWHFVEYNEELLTNFFTDSFKEYSDKNHHFSSLPHEQDFFALYYLEQNGSLPKNGTVLPGFLGDYFAGSMFKDKAITADASLYQDHYVSNRGCKFILNSVRLYEYFGLEWRIPFADQSILEYWLHIPIEQRLNENGYNEFMSEAFFKPLGIDFKKEDHYYDSKHLKRFIQSVLPETIVESIQANNSVKPENDPNNTFYLYKKLLDQTGETLKNAKFDFNEAHARFFLREIREKFATLDNYNSNQ